MKSNEEELGQNKIRWQANKDGGFSGVVIAATKRGDILEDDDEELLLARLRNEAATLEPNYFGMKAAIERFLKFMPGGFAGERNIAIERTYKDRVADILAATLPIKGASDATPESAAAIRNAGPFWSNLLSPYESMKLKGVLEGPQGHLFVQGAALFASGEYDAGATSMRKAMGGERLTWPIATYFPFFWKPEGHMFLKPTVTLDFAERIGCEFQYIYDANVDGNIYKALLEMAAQTRLGIAELNPSDHIDVQTFIFVVGGYPDEDMPD